MTEKVLHLAVVNAQEAIFSGDVKSLQVSGSLGEMGIYPGHVPLLTAIEPGFVSLETAKGDQQVIYVSGGIIEVQPRTVNILADVAIRGKDLDQEAALAAKKAAETYLRENPKGSASMDYAAALAELTNAIAQLRVLAMLRKKKGR
ncbi:F0F1 ATP synthase subunit epsilon [Psychrobium sp. 1_MG-2023]|uniref:F0F1 ATP synthase subunit epsilon n=1 Tax=Psychrobium sp. 1_MG-2023 TaxID=3062624 RepID=UPI000C335B4B|nr:F0F1 ATP synthase subunit epsilon [Psychrobium sp. 1_MG-2023]MDP2560774.1 F0F1 ATP synthase subunit epsilon [Psychrobium sp. 1_MG-2023]PKF56653.1 F0F1 ATP synthase subunit epsilon [Alteromonadales bacterium alter-6D02]